MIAHYFWRIMHNNGVLTPAKSHKYFAMLVLTYLEKMVFNCDDVIIGSGLAKAAKVSSMDHNIPHKLAI